MGQFVLAFPCLRHAAKPLLILWHEGTKISPSLNQTLLTLRKRSGQEITFRNRVYSFVSTIFHMEVRGSVAIGISEVKKDAYAEKSGNTRHRRLALVKPRLIV